MLKFYHLRPNKIGQNADLSYRFGRECVYNIVILLLLLLSVSVVVSVGVIVVVIVAVAVVVVSILLPLWKLMDGKKCMALCYVK